MTGVEITREARGQIAANELLHEAVVLGKDDSVFVTEWGDVLVDPGFSAAQLNMFQALAEHPRIGDDERLILLAAQLGPRLELAPQMGCWVLPLAAEYDDQGRARYPTISNAQLGLKSTGAHRATLDIVGGVQVLGDSEKHVDHRCMTHACCNPYHLEAVTREVNTRRGAEARRAARSPGLWQPEPGLRRIGEIAAQRTAAVSG